MAGEVELKPGDERLCWSLQGVLVPELDPGDADLGDLFDAAAIQSLMEDFHAFCDIPMALIDVKGRVLAGVGWQDICTKFHRVHPEACRHCIESDTLLTQGVPEGEFRLYRCRNHLRDVATPVMVGGRQVGNVFTGQFFLADEEPDREVFRAQASRYGFDEALYLEALDRVPRLSRETVDRAMAFLLKLAGMLSQQGYYNLQLARSLAERDAVMQELHRQREWLRVTLTSIGDAVLTTDTDGRVSFLNPVAEEVTGWTTEDAFNRPAGEVFRLVDEQTHLPSADIVGRVLSQGQRINLANHTALVTRDGREVPIEDSAAPILDASGRLAGVVIVFHDVTDKRGSLEALRRNEAQLKELNEALELRVRERTAELDRANHMLRMISECKQALVRVQDETRMIRQICEVITRMGGYRMAWVGYAENDERRAVRPVAFFGFDEGYLDGASITWSDDERGRGPTGTCIRTGEVQVCEDFERGPTVAPWRSEALKRGYRSSIALPLVSGGCVFGALSLYAATPGAFDDVQVALLRELADDLAFGIQVLRAERERDHALELSERRADQLRLLAVQLTQAERTERQRLAKVLHDHLQQLLVAAKLHIGLVSGRTADPGLRDSAALAETLLGDSIEMSRSLTVELSPPVLADGGLVAGLNWLVRRMREQHSLEVLLDSSDEAEPSDPDVRVFLFEAVRELLFNIVKHAGVLEALVRVDRTGTGRVRVVVEDGGRGFEADLVRVRGDGGTGLGLFSIQQRLEPLGGSLVVESAHGRGTRVTLIAPAGPVPERPVDPAPAVETPEPGPAHPAGSSRIRVLLADDHRMLRQGIAALLQGEKDIEVVGEAADGAAAVEACRGLCPDVVVMDISMPGMSGVEATRRILAESPAIRIIGLSMHEEGEMAAEMREAGAVDFMTKGGPREALVGAIRAAATPVGQAGITAPMTET